MTFLAALRNRSYAHLIGHKPTPPATRATPGIRIEIAEGFDVGRHVADVVRRMQGIGEPFGCLPSGTARPIPTHPEEARLTPWERAWGRLTDDEKTWSSRP